MNTTSKRVRLAAVTLCVATLVAAGCGSDDASASKKKKDATTTTTAAAGSPTTTTGGSGAPDQPGYTTLPAVGVNEPSPLAPNLTATVTKVEATKLKAQGPGDVAGPGVVVTVEIRNDTTQAVNLDLMAVTASYGTDTPASQNRGATTALAGQLEPGQSKSGSYGFRVPENATGPIRIDIQQSASPNIVIVQAQK